MANNTRFELVTPGATLFSGEAEMIVCATVEGEIAFLADHEPYIGALDPCLVRVVNPVDSTASAGGDEFKVAVHGGFVEVKDNQVIMLADMAQRPADVDRDEANRDSSDAESRIAAAPSGEPDKAAETDYKWARARLEALESA